MNLSKYVTLDVENYVNYFLVKVRRCNDGKTLFFEKYNDSKFDTDSLLNILSKYTIVTFNGLKYDVPNLDAIVCGFKNKNMNELSRAIIDDNLQPWQTRKQFGIRAIKVDHIDLKEVAPLTASLKTYGGRLHCPKMQDLPIDPYDRIKSSDVPDMRLYCGNDLEVTQLLLMKLKNEVELRINMSKQYDLDLRSKSDAQIAEAVIKHELIEKYNITPKKPKIKSGGVYQFKCPKYISFKSPLLRDILELFKNAHYQLGKSGHFVEPETLKGTKFTINNSTYKIGIGGLHSTEKKIRHVADEDYCIREYDFAAFYPAIILNNELTPSHIGKPFLEIYKMLVDTRLEAKRKGNKTVDASFKIVINGSFGKLGSKWSFLYAPDLMLHVTLIGQLTLLMVIEQMEEQGIEVISANTDGIVVKMLRSKDQQAIDIVDFWSFENNYELEMNEYFSFNSRDVNNYLAVKSNGKFKAIGAYADQLDSFYMLRKNPSNIICVEAIRSYIKESTPIEETIRECEDIRMFVNIRNVKGGGKYEGELLGKAVRWYYSSESLSNIEYVKNGNKVPKTDGCKPLMELTKDIPNDIDYQWYIDEAYKMLKNIGFEI